MNKGKETHYIVMSMKINQVKSWVLVYKRKSYNHHTEKTGFTVRKNTHTLYHKPFYTWFQDIITKHHTKS